jgi:hypothetical protein
MSEKQLGQQLIHSLTALRPKVKDKQSMNEILTTLKKVSIPDDDYEHVLKVLLSVIKLMPEVITAAPQNKSFIDLCLLCDPHVPSAKKQSTSKRD